MFLRKLQVIKDYNVALMTNFPALWDCLTSFPKLMECFPPQVGYFTLKLDLSDFLGTGGPYRTS